MNDSINTETREDVMQRVDELQGKLRDQLEVFDSNLHFVFAEEHRVETLSSEDLIKIDALLSVMLIIKDQIECLVFADDRYYQKAREG